MADDFYKGRTVRVVVGSGAGGGYDTFARVLSSHWPRHIPGNPTFIVTNMPGAGSLVAANHLANVADKDGSVIGGLNPGIVDTAILFPAKAKHDPRKLNWIGSILRETQLATAWHTSGVTKLDDVFKKELIVSASGGASEIYPKFLNGLLGTKFKVVSGYKGTYESFLALERGEAEGVAGITYASLQATQGAALKEGKIKIIAQFGLERHPELPDVPMVMDYGKTPDDKAALNLMLARQEFGRPFAAPPAIPADRLTKLRRSFDATMKDGQFLADVKKRKLDVDPITGERIQELVSKIFEVSDATVGRVREILKK
jgi:tripartite-type tricarboxylate transporter receptor subunit TctC